MTTPPTWEITVTDPAGGPPVRVVVTGGEVSVEPPDAVDLPFVGAVVRELRRSLARPRPRPACAADPRPAGG